MTLLSDTLTSTRGTPDFIYFISHPCICKRASPVFHLTRLDVEKGQCHLCVQYLVASSCSHVGTCHPSSHHYRPVHRVTTLVDFFDIAIGAPIQIHMYVRTIGIIRGINSTLFGNPRPVHNFRRSQSSIICHFAHNVHFFDPNGCNIARVGFAKTVPQANLAILRIFGIS